MRRISSRSTFWFKRVFPAFWFGFIALFLVLSIFGQPIGSGTPLPLLFIPIFMGVFGCFVMKKFVFDLVDDVFDDGDTLIVKKGRRADRIALADIKNVGYSPLISPPRVTLSLRKRSVFGDKVSFVAPHGLVPFWDHPIVNELIDRIDSIRETRRMV